MNENPISKNLKIASIKNIKLDSQYQSISESGLTKKQIEISRNKFGKNSVSNLRKDSIFLRIKRSFLNPFAVVLLVLAIISLFTDIIFPPHEKNYTTFTIIISMLLISGFVRLIQEIKSKKITDNLISLLNIVVHVKRDGHWTDLALEDIVVGDLIRLEPGNRVPADIRLINAHNLYVSQSVITGESEIFEKDDEALNQQPSILSDYKNIVFQGSTIVSGTCEGIALAVGNKTVYGGIKPDINTRKKEFEKGSNKIVWILIKFMAILVPLVFIISGITNGDWLASFLFALSVAVGLTPELLPMVLTACLSKGSYNMSKKQTIVKNINAMDGFGSMDTLCIDKTGTLTEDTLTLEYYMDILGNENKQVLKYALLNSYFASGIINHLDKAILHILEDSDTNNEFNNTLKKYKKLDEQPFDYTRKISSVLVQNENKKILISKGDVFEIAKKCGFYKFKNNINPIFGDVNQNIHYIIDDMLEDGMKVIGVAYKIVDKDRIDENDENDLILLGYIGFFDAPKISAESAINKLKNQNVNVKILTGDNLAVTLSICRRLGIDSNLILTGSDINKISENDLHIYVERTNIFAELTPKQKAQIVSILESNGHIVGFLGDGMNDLPAMIQADVSVSVDTASPSLKEIADVILLKKDLNVLEEGIIEGRKSFANMNKYIKITASSNLGNIISIIISSIFLPFFPMTAIQILLLNLLYDIICLVLPWDNVDKETCQNPLEWSGNTLKRFMLYFGPISTIFDIITFIFLYFYLCPTLVGGTYEVLDLASKEMFVSIFQTGFFLESMRTQILILLTLRTRKLSIVKSRPSLPVFIVIFLGIVFFTTIAMTPLGELIGLSRLPVIYFLFLVAVVLVYLLFITLAKKFYVKKYNSLI